MHQSHEKVARIIDGSVQLMLYVYMTPINKDLRWIGGNTELIYNLFSSITASIRIFSFSFFHADNITNVKPAELAVDTLATYVA